MLTLVISSAQKYLKYDPFLISLLFWCGAVFALFLANQLFYPQSQYAEITSTLFNDTIALILLLLLCFIYLSLLAHTAFIQIKKWPYLLLFALSTLFFIPSTHKTPTPIATNSKPNIIIIGIDSLHLKSLDKAPYLTQLLSTSSWFKNAKTPLARTFPAWVSILTGLYPTHQGAIFNLIDKSQVDNKKSIAWTLKKIGYQTVYASDEKRFSQIDTRFGFDKLIGSKTGVNDFIQSRFNDMPLSNLVMNTVIGRYLFPYNYANRAAYVHYFPNTFNKVIESSLKELTPEKPLFLSIHLTLTHWPLIWGETPKTALKHPNALYTQSLTRLDQQLKKIVATLEKEGRLSHTLLILLSDHGDAVSTPHSRLTTKVHYQSDKKSRFADLIKQNGEQLDKSFGHGTDVLSPNQSQTLLAFHFFDEPQVRASTIKTPVSLIDIKPTILAYLNQPSTKTDGVTLLPLLNNKSLSPRFFISETGFNPTQQLGKTLISDNKKIHQAILIGKTFYRVNKEDEQLVLKNEKINGLIKQKQVAIEYNNWLLALYPTQTGYIPVILNTQSGDWSDDLDTSFAKKSPASTLLLKLINFYPFLAHQAQTDNP
jgi:arylsulfatase A-like enzyme